LNYVRQHRFSGKYGLVWGATTADWGDVQPEHEWGVVLDSNSHKAIDIYDNAMFLIAISNYVALVEKDDPKAAGRWQSIHAKIKQSVRQHLWDSKNNKFIPHIYLDGSPFPAVFDESRVHYHGGTAVAIEAELLSSDEIRAVLHQMRANVRASGAAWARAQLAPAKAGRGQ